MNIVKSDIANSLLVFILLVCVCGVHAAENPSETENASAKTNHRWSLQECVAYALEHSPTLAKQQLAVKSQQLQSIIESAAFDVILNARDTETHTHNVQTTNSSDVSLTKTFESGFTVRVGADDTRRNGTGHVTNSMSIQISKQILGGGSQQEMRYAFEASEIDAVRELNTYQRQQRKLVLDVTLAYYAIIKAQASKQVKERALANAKSTLAVTREREKPLDMLTSELKVPENELAVNAAQRQITNGLVNLKVLMGFEVDAPFEIDGAFEYKAEQPNGEADRLFAEDNLETLLNSRLERKKLQMLLDIRDEEKLPDVSISATHRKYGRGGSFNFTGHEEQVFGVNLSWTLGRRADEARYGIAENNLERNRHDYFILVQELDSTIGNYLRQLAEYERAVVLQERICELNRQTEELYRDRWENGEIDILELVRTQTSLEDSLVELNNRKVAYMELLANYRYAIGK